MAAPPAAAIAAIIAGDTHVTRRCEIYEEDGITPFAPSFSPRAVSGSVTVDMSRDERRALELTLDNSDGLISHDPHGGLWYDKVIKVFRGVRYANTKTQPFIAIVEANIGNSDLPRYLAALGFTQVVVFPATATLDDLIGFDIIAATYEGTADISTGIAALLLQAYNAGQNVLTVSPFATAATVPLIGALASLGSLTSTSEWDVIHLSSGNPFADYEDYEVHTIGNPPWTLPTAVAANTLVGATAQLVNNSVNHAGIALLYQSNPTNSAKWAHYHVPLADVNPAGNPMVGYQQWHNERDIFLDSVIDWIFNYQPDLDWETQVGEFLIDSIHMPRFPRQISVTCRDMWKKLMDSKFDNTLSFSPGILVDTLVSEIAANASITKFRLGGQGAVTQSTFTFDGASARGDAIKGICQASNLEVFFDKEGYLTTRPFYDPTTSMTTLTLSTGDPDGNLIDFSEDSNDDEMYNRFVVSGTSQDDSEAGNIYQGIAENHEPSSPTSIENLRRVKTYYYSSSFFTSNDQCLAYANSLMQYHALESFSLAYTCIAFAWLEAGEIVAYDAEDAQPGTPNRFLNTDFSIPLTLDAMTGNAKRITIVG